MIQKSWNEADFRQFDFFNYSFPRIGYGEATDFGIGYFYQVSLSSQTSIGSKIGLLYKKFNIQNTQHFPQKIDENISNISFDEQIFSPLISLFLRHNFISSFSIIASIDFGYNFAIKTSLIEKIKESINEYSPPKPKIPYTLTFDIGFGYRLPFRFFGSLSPEAIMSYNFGYAQPEANFILERKSLRLSLNFFIEKPKISTNENIMLPEPIESLDSIISKKATEISENDSINIYYIGIDHSKIYPPVIKIEKKFIKSFFPLLNYVFFEYANYDIPKRYRLISKEEVPYFSTDSFNFSNPIDVYHQILNIIGYRMREYPKANLIIIGCNSNIGEERENLDLSKRRAEKIANYFIDTWGIEKQRIHIQFRNLPEKPSNTNSNEGNQENQRVEILSDNPNIFAPLQIVIEDKKITPEKIRFYIQLRNRLLYPLGTILELFCLKQTIFSTKTIIQNSFDSIEITLNQITDINSINNPIDFSFKVFRTNDSAKIQQTIRGSIPIISEKNLQFDDSSLTNQLNLILFDFSSSKLNEQHLSILRSVRPQLLNSKKVFIIGHTDKVGLEEYNQKLSFERAKAVAAELGIPNVSIIGEGEKFELFNNKLPEGRFYSRIVRIVFD